MKTALFYGAFDPCHNGHLWLVARSLALDLFDKIVVALVNDPARQFLFTIDERVKLWLENAQVVNERRIEVAAIDEEYPVQTARRLGCQFLLRGIRSAQQYEVEIALQRTNHNLEPMIQTVFLAPDEELARISGSMVRSMIGKPGWKEDVKRHVPVATWESLVRKFGRAGTGG